MAAEQQEQPTKPPVKRTARRAAIEHVRVRRWVKIPKKKLTPAMQAKVLERKDKQKRALDARKAGASYKDIGVIVGVSTSYARDLVLRAANEVIVDDAKEVIQMDLLRLDEMQMLATRALRQNGDLNQIERIMRIMRERRDILGLTTDSWKEQQSERAGSMTNNGIMIVQGGSEDFVRSMMQAVGVDPNSPEAQARLERIKREEEAKGEGEYALKAPRPNELLMAAADSALNVNHGNVIEGEVIKIEEEDI